MAHDTAPKPVHGVLCVDKSVGCTSHDVVQRARRALRTRAVGHAGTLDPMASGLLILGFGEGTKLLRYLTDEDKTYRAMIVLGEGTETLDAEGAVCERMPYPSLSDTDVQRVLDGMLGPGKQQAPIYSAIKQGGQPLYARARRGEVVHAPFRDVVLHEAQLQAMNLPELTVRLCAKKGYYVRSCARDLASALGTVGHLGGLRRLASGAFGLADAVDYEALLQASLGDVHARASVLDALIDPAEACRGFIKLVLSDEGHVAARHGKVLGADAFESAVDFGATPDGFVALLSRDGCLVAIAEKSQDQVRISRGFNLAVA